MQADFTTDESIYVVDRRLNPYERVSEIAERLNVSPIDEGYHGWVVQTEKGMFDIYELIHALLDKIDKNA